MVKRLLILIALVVLLSGCTRKLFISDHGDKKIITCDLKKNLSGDFNECINSVVLTDVVDAFSAHYIFTDSDRKKLYVYDDKLIQSISFDDFSDRDTITTRALGIMGSVYYDDVNKLFIGSMEQNPRLVLINSTTGVATDFDKTENSEKPYAYPTTATFDGKTFVYWIDNPKGDNSKLLLRRKELSKTVADSSSIVLTNEDVEKDGYSFDKYKRYVVHIENGEEILYWTYNPDPINPGDIIVDEIVKTNLSTKESEAWVRNRDENDRTIHYPHGITIGNKDKTIFFVTNSSKIVGAKKIKTDSPTEYSILEVDYEFNRPTIIRYAGY